MQNATVRGDVTLLKTVIGLWNRVIFVRETEAIIRKAPLVLSPKQVIVPILIFLYFFVLYFPSHAVWEIFSLFDTFSCLPRDRGNYKESVACPITKASNSSHFYIPLMFLFSTFPVMQYQRFFLFLIPFLILEILRRRSAESYYKTRTGTCFVRSTKLSPVARG